MIIIMMVTMMIMVMTMMMVIRKKKISRLRFTVKYISLCFVMQLYCSG